MLGRDLSKIIIIDNSPISYQLQPENALPISSWFDDKDDRELLRIIPILKEFATISNVKQLVPTYVNDGKILFKDNSEIDMLEIPQNSINIDPTEIDFNMQKKSSGVGYINDLRILNRSTFPKLFAKEKRWQLKRSSDLYRLNQPSFIKVNLFSNGVLSSAPVTNMSMQRYFLNDRLLTPQSNAKRKSLYNLSGGKSLRTPGRDGNELIALMSSMGATKDDKSSSIDDNIRQFKTYTSERKPARSKHIFIKLA